MMYLIFILTSLVTGVSSARSTRPHIIHILADDIGWAEVGYHNPVAKLSGDIRTPNIDALVTKGLELDRFYAEKICSPTRSSLQTGRFGIHVNVQNVFPDISNPNDVVGGYQVPFFPVGHICTDFYLGDSD
jgi:arylsulfatase A-like enzyme